MPGNDGGFRHSEPYVEMVDPPLWRAEADAHVHRLLATPMSARGRWERISTELVYRARATPLWSEGAAAVPAAERMLDRVVDFRIVVRLLIGHPADAPEILDVLGVGCVLSQPEAQRLGSIRPDAGWEAYAAAGLRIVDAESGTPFDIAAAAQRQRELLTRLRAPTAAMAGTATPAAWPAPDPSRRGEGDLTPPAGTRPAGPAPARTAAEPSGTPAPTTSTASPAWPDSPTSPSPPTPPPDTALTPGQPLVMRPGAVRLANADVLETFVPVLRQLVGEAARITYGSNWITASAENEHLKVTFGRPAPGTAVVSARVHNGRGHDDQVEDVVRHVSQDELLPATIAALVRVHDAARVASETRLREVEAASQMRSPRLVAEPAATAAGQPVQQPLPAPQPPPQPEPQPQPQPSGEQPAQQSESPAPPA